MKRLQTKRTHRSDFEGTSNKIFSFVFLFSNFKVTPTVSCSNASKKQRTSVADITHESMERLKPNMDRHTYTVRVRDADFFNRQRSLEASFELVIRKVVDIVLRDLEYDSSNMRASVNFSFNDGAPRDQQYFVNINWRDVAASITVSEMMRRLQGSFQSADKAMFSKFKVVIKIFRIAKGNGVTKTSKDGKNTREFTPMDISFNHPHIPKFHLKEGNLRSRTVNDGMFHKYAGCVWDSAKKTETFWKGIEMCEEEGGQLMSFEKFPTEEEFTDYIAKLNCYLK
ncbi:hypothetical protein Avbf_17461 [Armadillidium vulgare]|nr:hypothetical protein Avbf_17461 [Armadillidium vulgare]